MNAHYNVLFLCTGNSARSILAEAILNQKGQPNFTAYSAGSHPTGAVRPEALRQLEASRLPTLGLRSKSWGEFAEPGAPARSLTLPGWISFSPFVTMPRTKSVRCGRANR